MTKNGWHIDDVDVVRGVIGTGSASLKCSGRGKRPSNSTPASIMQLNLPGFVVAKVNVCWY